MESQHSETLIQHPYSPAETIALDRLLDLIGHELDLIELDEESLRSGTELLNDVVARVTDPGQRAVLTAAIDDRFIGD